MMEFSTEQSWGGNGLSWSGVQSEPCALIPLWSPLRFEFLVGGSSQKARKLPGPC